MGLSALPNFSRRHRVPAENRNEDGKPGAFAPQRRVSLACVKPLFSLRKSLSLISSNGGNYSAGECRGDAVPSAGVCGAPPPSAPSSLPSFSFAAAGGMNQVPEELPTEFYVRDDVTTVFCTL